MSSSPQFELYSHASGPNGWKVAFVLEALGLTYQTHYLDLQKGEQKDPSFTQYNPNGRIPAIIDHGNDDFALWESNAILLYLVEHYDKEGKLGVAKGDSKKKAALDQWLFFQASGQGPYFGQGVHFKIFAPEKVPYAITRYESETIRVLGVLDGVLAKSPFLLGDKPTIADISFITWNEIAFNVILEAKKPEDFPNTFAWHKKLLDLPYVKSVLEEKAKLNAKK